MLLNFEKWRVFLRDKRPGVLGRVKSLKRVKWWDSKRDLADTSK